MNLPQMPEGISTAWLTKTLRASELLDGHSAVVGFELQQIGDGVGMMSELAQLQLSYAPDAAGPSSLVIKFPSRNATNREVAMDFHVYEREVKYYQELDSQTNLTTPAVYHVEMAQDNFAIMMEDLSAYRSGDQVVGASLQESELAIDELVKLHGAFWGKIDDYAWVPGVSESYHADNLYNFVQAGWPVMMEHFGHLVDPAIEEAFPRYVASIRELQSRMCRQPRTLLHGDFRMENFFFGVEPGHQPMVIFDWQGPLLGCGMVDVAQMLGHSSQISVRRENEKNLIRRYVSGLHDLGVDYSAEQAWQDYVDAVLYMWLYTGRCRGHPRC